MNFRKLFLPVKIICSLKNPILYFEDYFNFSKKKMSLYIFRIGLKILLRKNTSDRMMVNDVFFYQDYTKFFGVKKGDTVFDIGAHIGSFSLYAAKKAGSSGRVYSFEPSKESFDLLSKNKKINNLENLKIFNLAVSNKGGIKKFFVSNSGNQAANSLFEINNAKEVKVSVISFENFLKQNKIKTIDFLKMDCEGGEYDILFNSSKKTMQKIKKISLEYHPIDNKKNKFTIINFLRKHNFLIKEGSYFGGPGILYAIKKDENRGEKKVWEK